MTDIAEWFKSLPTFTRYWLGLTGFFSLLGRFHIIHPMYFLLTYEDVFNKFQFWKDILGELVLGYETSLWIKDYCLRCIITETTTIAGWMCYDGGGMICHGIYSTPSASFSTNDELQMFDLQYKVNFQIWRLCTSLFYYPINGNTGIHFLFNCYFLYNYSLNLETGAYSGRPADYAFLLLFNWICILISAFIFKFYILMDCAVMSVLYIWSQLHKEVIVNFWFGTRFKAMYLPWILFGFNLIINGIGMMDLIGIVIGHLYYFLCYQYPTEFNGPTLITTPSFLYHLFPNERIMSQFGQAPQRRPNLDADPQRRTGGHNWGQGHVLGGR